MFRIAPIVLLVACDGGDADETDTDTDADVARTASVETVLTCPRDGVDVVYEVEATEVTQCELHGSWEPAAFLLVLRFPDESVRPDQFLVGINGFDGEGEYRTSVDSYVSVQMTASRADGGAVTVSTIGEGAPDCAITVLPTDLGTIEVGGQTTVELDVTCAPLWESGNDAVTCALDPDTFRLAVPCTRAD